jgi:hypothetical protein
MDDKEETTTTEDEGVQPKTNTIVDDTNLAAKRLEEATAAAREERLAAEDSYGKMKLGGQADAGTATEKPKKLTDTEYAEALQRGEVNPLAEDGIF